jgi:Ku protein
MGRAACFTEGRALPPAAREEAEQREHENDDQDNPENAQCSHLLRASSSSLYNGFPALKVSQAGLDETRLAGIIGLQKPARLPRQQRFSCRPAGQRQAMPRAIWSGSISFGLVNVPVRMYSAISEHKLHFHFVHEPDQSPIGYQKVCKLEDKPVPDDEVVKAFEFEPGEYVFMEDEDFEAARVEGYKTIEITDFVQYEQVDPIYFARTYYLGPEEGGEKVYTLLLRALEDSGLAGISKFVMGDRQYLGALRARDGVIILEQMYFADEIRPPNEIKPPRTQVSKEELAMAEQLIENFAGDFKPEKYKDTYRDALCAIIRAKRAGKEVHRAPETEEAAPPDLLEALRASIDAAGGGRGRSRGRASSNGPRRGDLSGLSKAQLDDRARKAKIPGRSKMSKDELIEALSEAA